MKLTPKNDILGVLRRQGALLSLCVLYVVCRWMSWRHAFDFFKNLIFSETEGLYPKGIKKWWLVVQKKNPTIFRHLTVTTFWGLRWAIYSIFGNVVFLYISGGVPNIFFSKHVVINAYRTNVLENKILGPSTYPHVQFLKKSKKMVQYLEKTMTFSFSFFRVTSAKKKSSKIQKFRNTSFCS